MVVNILQFQYLVSVVNHKSDKTKKKKKLSTTNGNLPRALPMTEQQRHLLSAKRLNPELLQLLNFNTPEVEQGRVRHFAPGNLTGQVFK